MDLLAFEEGGTVQDLLFSFEKVYKVKNSYEFIKSQKGNFKKWMADKILVLKVFNWSEKINLNHICSDGWKWKINYPNGFIKK